MSNAKILVVDDVASMRSVTKSILMLADYNNITMANDGAHALVMLEKNTFDLIICDWEMPSMSGIELLVEIRKDDHHKNTPFLMLTSISDKVKASAAIKAGATDYVIKPIQASALLEKINKCLGK